MNWSNTTKAKSDQLNADDLISGAITIKIRDVKINLNDAQSGIIYYEGDNGKPYKPCKSMRRVIELKWGADEKYFIGKSMTLVRDETVTWAGEEVGGIRISHMSDMKNDDRFMLTFSKNMKKGYKVNHLRIQEQPKAELVTIEDVTTIKEWLVKVDMDAQKFCEAMEIESISELPKSKMTSVIKRFQDILKQKKGE